MSKKITAGDTLTVGDLTDAHLGAVIEVGPTDGGITFGFRIDRIECYGTSQVKMLTTEGGAKHADLGERVTVITPPPVVQPYEPKVLGQCIRIEGDDGWLGIVADPQSGGYRIWDTGGYWFSWDAVLHRAGDRRIIVSDPPRWPDETPDVPERIERGEWPADDTHLRDYKWIDRDGGLWRWDDRDNRKSGWNWNPYLLPLISPLFGPWTRGERVK